MKNKLLVTTALVGMVASGAALAETKLSGNMVLGYKAMSFNATNPAADDQGFGRETQINISNSGTLNNNLKYAAGFSIEMDGDSVVGSDENVHFDVISGNTRVSFGMDHAPNMSISATPRVAEHADTTFGYDGSTALNSYDYNAGMGIDAAFQIAVIQKIAGGQVSFGFVPQMGDGGGDDQDIGGQATTELGNSAYQLIYSGNAGIDGLNLKAAYSKEDYDATQQDGKVMLYGVGYNFGKFAAGVTVKDIEESVIGTETKSYEFGATVALSDNLSAGLLYIETDGKDAGVAWSTEEKMTIGNIAYNLGAATVSFSAGTLEDRNGASTNKDIDVMSVRLGTKF